MPTSTTGHSVTPLAVGTAGYTLSYSGAVTPSASQTLNLSVTAAASETVTYLHSDTLGNVIGESKADGTFTRYHYKPYGERVESQPERLGFTGHLHQKELGLTYMQARHFDPLMGRFYGNDPIGFTGDPMSFNRYAYGNNNPYTWVDPSGMSPDGLDWSDNNCLSGCYGSGPSQTLRGSPVEQVWNGGEAAASKAEEKIASAADATAAAAKKAAPDGVQVEGGASAPGGMGGHVAATYTAQGEAFAGGGGHLEISSSTPGAGGSATAFWTIGGSGSDYAQGNGMAVMACRLICVGFGQSHSNKPGELGVSAIHIGFGGNTTGVQIVPIARQERFFSGGAKWK